LQTRDSKEFMSQSGWYHDKAAESDRMAVASRSPAARSRHMDDGDRWREIAASIDAAEEAVKQRKKERVSRRP
jgi:hypothetical protein